MVIEGMETDVVKEHIQSEGDRRRGPGKRSCEGQYSETGRNEAPLTLRNGKGRKQRE